MKGSGQSTSWFCYSLPLLIAVHNCGLISLFTNPVPPFSYLKKKKQKDQTEIFLTAAFSYCCFEMKLINCKPFCISEDERINQLHISLSKLCNGIDPDLGTLPKCNIKPKVQTQIGQYSELRSTLSTCSQHYCRKHHCVLHLQLPEGRGHLPLASSVLPRFLPNLTAPSSLSNHSLITLIAHQ